MPQRSTSSQFGDFASSAAMSPTVQAQDSFVKTHVAREASIDRPDHSWPDLIRVAVDSARQHSSLRPHMLYDSAPSDFTQEMGTAGGHRHFSPHTIF
jgi:hypothetical protein